MQETLVGQWLGQYQLTEQIDGHGLTAIYKASKVTSSQPVALKILPPYLTDSPEFSDQFSEIGRQVAALSHPNILPIYEVGQDNGHHYIVMQYVSEAKTLADVASKQTTQTDILQRLRQIATALDYAHNEGIIHHDLKPSNILFAGDQIKLSDFGLANIVSSSHNISVGTPAYLSPEQSAGKDIDHRSDIYALGIIAFEMLTGYIPHQAETPLAVSLKRQNEPPPSIREIAPHLPQALDQVLNIALATNPQARYQKAIDFVDAIATAFKAHASPVETSGDGIATKNHTSGSLKDIQQEGTGSQAGKVVKWGITGILSLTGLCGLFMMFFQTFVDQGSFHLAGGFGGFGGLLASFSTLTMLWFRQNKAGGVIPYWLGTTAWFLGISSISTALFILVLSESLFEFVDDLSNASAFCIAPGLILAITGLGLYTYAHIRQGTEEYQAEGSRSATVIATQNHIVTKRADKLKRATDYQKQITQLLKEPRVERLLPHATDLIQTLAQWDERLEKLVWRLNMFEKNHTIQRDIQEVPQAIAWLEKRQQAESDTQVKATMGNTLQSYHKQQGQLEALVNLMRRTELEIDQTVSTMGTIYSQLHVLKAKEIDQRSVQRLSSDIQEETDRLGDLLSAMDEVYQT